MKSKKAQKKVAKNLFRKNVPFYTAGTILAIVFLLGILYFYFNFKGESLNFSSHPTKQDGFKISSPSATPKPTEIPIYHPVSSGFQERVPILYFHYIGNNPNPADKARDSLSISPDKFDAQMKYLKDNGYTTVSLDTLMASLQNKTPLPPKTVILTFDDGYIDFYYNAYPILKKYNFSGTVFIITGFVGGDSYLNWAQIKEMSASGSIIFGAHTVHHYHLTSVSPQVLQSELEESKKTLQAELGIPINFVAYPYGSTNDFVIQAAKKAGFIGAVGTWPNKTQSEGTIFNIPRMRVSGLSDLGYFIQLL